MALDRDSDIRPRNAQLRMTIRRMKVRRARMGWSIDEKALALLARPAARRPVGRPRRARGARAGARRSATSSTCAASTGRSLTDRPRQLQAALLQEPQARKRSYGIAVGAPGFETPTGRFSIHNKAVNPAWSAPDEPWAGAYRNEVVEGGAPDNPLKARWMGIVGGVGIHGTAAE